MNERIKQLAEHCDFYVGNEHYDKPHEEQQRLFMEKFAELIVRECIDIVKDVDKNPYLEDHHHARQINRNITKRFGIQ